MSSLVTRFAPSPTGRLHLGHAASALTVWRLAREAGGRVLLRIEDIDRTRCRPEFEAGIVEDLAWLGLNRDSPVRRQSDHFDAYRAALETLHARGLVYRCFRTRSEIAAAADRAPHGREPVYRSAPLASVEEARRLKAGEPHAWRLDVEAAIAVLGDRAGRLAYTELGSGAAHRVRVDPDAVADVVLARKDTPTSYHLACCHDDALQGVTHVIRGADLEGSTPVHVLLQALMDWPTPLYHHHPLMTGPDGRRLAKRDHSVTLAFLRENGVTPDEIRRMCAP